MELKPIMETISDAGAFADVETAPVEEPNADMDVEADNNQIRSL